MLMDALIQDQDSVANKILKLEHQNQVNLNERLDKMRFNDYTETEFNTTKPHKKDEISFVTDSSGNVSLYKGDVLLSGKGGDLQVTYAYVTDKDRGKGRIEQQTENRLYRGKYSQHDIYTGSTSDRKLGNIIIGGLQVGLDSNINPDTMNNGSFIQAPAFAGGLCPYISFNVRRNHKETRPNGTTVNTSRNETLEYWISLEGIRGISKANIIEKNGTVIPDEYTHFYVIKGKRTIKTSPEIIQEFDILNTPYGQYPFFESNAFNPESEKLGDKAVSYNGIRLACSDVEYTKDQYSQIKNPVLTAFFATDFERFSGYSVDDNPYIQHTAYLLESKERPFGLRFDPETGEKLESPRISFSDDNERKMAYIVSFKDDEEVK